MATISVITPGMTETSIVTLTACDANGDVVPNDGQTLLRFKTTHTSTITVTVAAQKADPNAYTSYNDITVTVPANTGDVIVGPFPKEIYDNTSGQLVITYDAVTATSMQAFSTAG